jgi:hypothetical protein
MSRITSCSVMLQQPRLLLLLLLVVLSHQTHSSSSGLFEHAAFSNPETGLMTHPAAAARQLADRASARLPGFYGMMTHSAAAAWQLAAASASDRRLQAGFAQPAPGANLCSPPTQNFSVSTTAEADAAAAGIRCNGGRFYVLWNGHVMLNSTFRLPTGNGLYVIGNSSDAIMDGGGRAQLIEAAPGSHVSLTGMRLQGGLAFTGGGAVAAAAARVDAKDCSFFNNSAPAGDFASQKNTPLHAFCCPHDVADTTLPAARGLLPCRRRRCYNGPQCCHQQLFIQ